MIKRRLIVISLGILLSTLVQVMGNELLINGHFEIGRPEDEKPALVVCPGWRRQLWAEHERNTWLTDGTRDRPIGADNQALEFRWGDASMYQYFGAVPGAAYTFSVEHLNPGTPENRWQPRIQVEWMSAAGKPIGPIMKVAEADITTAAVRTWNVLKGTGTAPEGTAYARILLNIHNRGAGAHFQRTYLDNASVQGVAGTQNLPVSFFSSPYPMNLDAIPESTPFSASLTDYADDNDGDKLTFTRISGPDWLTVEANGTLHGTPRFAHAGVNAWEVKVEDGHGSSDTQTLTIPVIGHLRLSHLFHENMVLQRDTPIPVWGKAVANTPVRILMSTGASATITADAEGHWSVVLPAQSASVDGPVTMTVRSGEREVQLTNLLVGDVWLCSGQSNMAWPLQHTDNSPATIAAAKHPNLRLVTTPDIHSATPQEDLDARAAWQVCTPSTVTRFSAVGYFFGRKLVQETGIPIGLISSSQGGTRIEPWSGGPLYNARVHPYTRMPIKGVIWYQGEANRSDGPAYTAKMQALVRDWRAAWGLGDFPFYYVQLAPFNYKGDDVHKLPELWAAQTAALALIPNSGMAVINDAGNIKNIHPTKKRPVGERLALWALHDTYGQTDRVYAGPMVRTVKQEGGTLRVSFDHVGSGLTSRDGGPLTGFEVAGEDQVYVPAEAVVEDDTVRVHANGVAQPAWVRFAWHEAAQPNLMNREGLPANSFMKKAPAF